MVRRCGLDLEFYMVMCLYNIIEGFRREILIKLPKLEYLGRLNTPQISLSKKVDSLRGITIQLYDTELLALPSVTPEEQKGMNESDSREGLLYGCVKPVVRQMTIKALCETGDAHRDTDEGIHLESLFVDGVLQGYRHHTCLRFEETNISPSALIDGIAQYFHCVRNQTPFLNIITQSQISHSI